MIVDPDFLSHWKTQMLIVELNDKAAPLYVISLWAHCQQRRQDRWDVMLPNALKAICRYEGEASKLRSALERCGFIDANGDGIIVHGWAEVNAKLIAQWTNGPKGGRPKEPKTNPAETHGKPNGNPKSIWVNPTVTDRVEKKGEDRKEPDPSISPPPPATAEDSKDPRHYAVTSQWGKHYASAFGSTYVASGRDFSTLKRFLESCRDDAETILTVAVKAWERSKQDRFAKHCKEAGTIHGFCSRYNDVRVELQVPQQMALGGQPAARTPIMR